MRRCNPVAVHSERISDRRPVRSNRCERSVEAVGECCCHPVGDHLHRGEPTGIGHETCRPVRRDAVALGADRQLAGVAGDERDERPHGCVHSQRRTEQHVVDGYGVGFEVGDEFTDRAGDSFGFPQQIDRALFGLMSNGVERAAAGRAEKAFDRRIVGDDAGVRTRTEPQHPPPETVPSDAGPPRRSCCDDDPPTVLRRLPGRAPPSVRSARRSRGR